MTKIPTPAPAEINGPPSPPPTKKAPAKKLGQLKSKAVSKGSFVPTGTVPPPPPPPKKKAPAKKTAAKRAPAKKKFEQLRDERGLLKNVEYVFRKDGMVDWRAMIPQEFLYPNREWFEARHQDVPSSIEGLEDHQLLVKLGGIKYVARLRGIDYVDYEFAPHSTVEHVAVKCMVTFINNYEGGEKWNSLTFAALGNASLANTSDFVSKFLEAIAENRAFVRCVRNALNINIVGDDEIDKNRGASPTKAVEKDDEEEDNPLPKKVLKKVVENKLGVTEFSDFIPILREMYADGLYKPSDPKKVKEWADFSDIPVSEVKKIISAMHKKNPS